MLVRIGPIQPLLCMTLKSDLSSFLNQPASVILKANRSIMIICNIL
jgi:hypothetical protein